MTQPPKPSLTDRVRAWLRTDVPWPAVLGAGVGVSTVALLSVAGIVGLGGGAAAWLTSMGMNALAGWVGALAAEGTVAPFRDEKDAVDPAQIAALAQQLQQRAEADAALAGDLSRLLTEIQAVPSALAGLRDDIADIGEEVGAQSELLIAQQTLLTGLQADVQGIAQHSTALQSYIGTMLRSESDRVISAGERQAQRLEAADDANTARILASIDALREALRAAPLIQFGDEAQFGDLSINAVAKRDVNQNKGDVIYGKQEVRQYFFSHSRPINDEAIIIALDRLAKMPINQVPEISVLPRGSRMQLHHNEFFVGRQKDLSTLAEALKGSEIVAINQVQSAVSIGLGGIGKTQLAVEFVHRYGQYFSGVFWLSFEQANLIPEEVARCGSLGYLQLFTNTDDISLADRVQLVQAQWSSGLPYLLIFDNCEDVELASLYRPTTGASRILITSRNSAWSQTEGVRVCTLGELQRQESITLLRRYRPDLKNADADAIANEVGDLPLALHMAGSFLADSIVRPSNYLAELQSSRIFQRLTLLDEEGRLPTGHARDVARTFALSLEQLNDETAIDSSAMQFLQYASCLAPGELIPKALLAAISGSNLESFDAQKDVTLAFKRLVRLGLIEQVDADTVRLHRLLATYVRQSVMREKLIENIEKWFVNFGQVGKINEDGQYISIQQLLLHFNWVFEEAEKRRSHFANRLRLLLSQIYLSQITRFYPIQFRTAIQRIAEDYGAVFGGRDVELQRLNTWLSDDLRPYAFLHAPTGRGKTALLVHWVAQVEQQGIWQVVFVPISIRYQIATAGSVLSILAIALAQFHGELDKLNTTNTSPDQLRPIIADYLRREPADDRRLLVVLDGLDEATGWTVGRELFPREPGAHVRLVASARERAHMSLEDWLTQLGWEGQTCDLGLEGLNQAAVSDVLRRMDNPLDALATNVDLLSDIARASQGDPLTIRYLVEALKDGSLSPGKLEALTPGLESSVRVWLEELAQHAANANAVYALLSLCAVALGPLTTADVQRLEPATFKRKAALNQAAKTVGRFVIGDGSEKRGYVFGHPRLRELYLEEILSDAERDEALQRFVEDGRRWYDERTGAAPVYIRQFWVTHLTQSGEWELAAQVVTGIEATEHGHYQAWAQLRYAAEGSYSGYLSDLDAIWQRADAVSDVALGVRSVVIVATVRSLSGNISPELLYQLVTVGTPEGKWSIASVLEVVRQMPNDQRKAEAIAKLAPIIPEHAMGIALELVRGIGYERSRADALTDLAPHLTLTLQVEALAAARAITDEWCRAKTLTALAPHLPPPLLAEALAAARAITNEWCRERTLTALAPHLPPGNQPAVLADALVEALGIEDVGDRVHALAALAPQLSYSDQPAVLAKALAQTRGIGDVEARAYALAALAPRLPSSDQPSVLAETLVAARAITNEKSRTEALIALAPHLPPNDQSSVLAEALVAARAITNDKSRAEILTALAPHLPPPLLAEALAAARAITKEWNRERILTALAPHLPPPLLAEALTAAQAIMDGESRERTLIALAPHLPPPLLAEALAAARAITKDWSRVRTLTALVPHLPPNDQSSVLAEALVAARAITNDKSRARAMTMLALYLPPNDQLLVLAEVLAAAWAITNEWSRVRTLTALAPHLPPPLLAEALVAARAITNEWSRMRTLTALAPHLPSPLLAEVLAAAQAIEDKRSRADVLTELAPHLPPDLLADALAAVHAIGDEGMRLSALTALAPRLPPILLVKALATAREMRSNSNRSSTLTTLAPHLAKHRIPLSTWQETLHTLARNGRPALLNDLTALTPWLVALTTPEQRAEVAQAVIDVCKAWP